VLNVFPGGRRNGHIWAFDSPVWPGDVIGLQIGVDLNLKSALDNLYFGAVLEPIAGLSLNGGLALVKGQFVPAGYAANMLIPTNETFTPDSRYLPACYVGLTLSNEIFSTIVNAARTVRTTASSATQ
jgi:hypothetical protein